MTERDTIEPWLRPFLFDSTTKRCAPSPNWKPPGSRGPRRYATALVEAASRLGDRKSSRGRSSGVGGGPRRSRRDAGGGRAHGESACVGVTCSSSDSQKVLGTNSTGNATASSSNRIALLPRSVVLIAPTSTSAKRASFRPEDRDRRQPDQSAGGANGRRRCQPARRHSRPSQLRGTMGKSTLRSSRFSA